MRFEHTIYEVAETDRQVEVCVILIRPDDATDIAPNMIGVEVFEDDATTSELIPSGAAIASEFLQTHIAKKRYIAP